MTPVEPVTPPPERTVDEHAIDDGHRHLITAKRIAAASFALLVVVAIVSYFGLLRSGDSARDSAAARAAAEEVTRGNELRACQAAARAPVDDALLEFDRAVVREKSLLLAAIAAASDRAEFMTLAGEADSVRRLLEQRFMVREVALMNYQARIRTSVGTRNEVSAFLADCHAGFLATAAPPSTTTTAAAG